MRVVLIFGNYPPLNDGGAHFVKNLATGLAAAGVEPFVVTTSKVRAHYQSEGAGDSGVHVLPIIEDWKLQLAGARLLKRTLNSIDPDVVHLIYPASRIGNDYQLPGILRFISRSPLVTTFFNFNIYRGVTMLTRLVTISVMLGSCQSISHSDFYYSLLRRVFPFRRQRIHFFPCASNISLEGVDLTIGQQALRGRYGLELEIMYLSYFGGGDRSRGLETLFRALHDANRSVGRTKLIMIGSGGTRILKAKPGTYSAQLRCLAESLGVYKDIVLTGFCSDEDVAGYFRASDVCVLPFRRNKLGRTSLAAALELGMPIITTADPAGNLLPLKHKENIFLIPADDVTSLKEAIQTVCESAHLRKQLSKGAKELAKEFSWKQLVKKTIAVYREALRCS